MRLGETIFLTSLKAGSKHSFPDSTNKYSFHRLLKRDLMKEKIKTLNIYLSHDKTGLFLCNNHWIGEVPRKLLAPHVFSCRIEAVKDTPPQLKCCQREVTCNFI